MECLLDKVLFLGITVFDVVIFGITMIGQIFICMLWYKMGMAEGHHRGFSQSNKINEEYFTPKIRDLAIEVEERKRTIAQLKLEKEQLATEKEQLLDQNANYEKTCEGLRNQIAHLNSGTAS